MKKSLLSLVAASAIATSSLHADFIGFEGGAALWMPKTTGTFQNGSTEIDLEKDLKYGDTVNANYIWAWIDHPLPLIPNVKVTHTTMTDSTDATTSKSINFAGQNFNLSAPVKSETTIDQTDFTIYYRILDNWVNLDLGLTAKNISGTISIDTIVPGTSAKKDFELWMPMAYGKGKFDFPFTGLSVEVEAHYVGYDGNKIYDAKAGVVYETSIGLGATVGLRQEKMVIDDVSGINSDIDITGVYAGLFYHF
jgi:outer membrane protein